MLIHVPGINLIGFPGWPYFFALLFS